MLITITNTNSFSIYVDNRTIKPNETITTDTDLHPPHTTQMIHGLLRGKKGVCTPVSESDRAKFNHVIGKW